MKEKSFFSLGLVLLLVTGFFSSCSQNADVTTNVKVSTGLFLLNEGKYGSNNASLTYYDYGTGLATNDVFNQKNNRGLGDTGQDMIQYGSKIYIAVYGSSLIEVMDLDGNSIKSIPVESDSVPEYPRSMAATGGKVYVSLYDGHVARLDTATLAFDAKIAVGTNPEGVAIVGNNLYVANSGGMQTVMDSTISVINLSTFTETKKIKVVVNPQGVKADQYGDLYVISNGNYGDIPVTLQCINTTNDSVSVVDSIQPYGMDIVGDSAYFYQYTYDANWNATDKKITIYDVKNKVIKSDNILTSSDEITNVPYSIAVNPITKDIYVGATDYVDNGKVYCFSSTGELKFTFTAGVNPSKFVFLSK